MDPETTTTLEEIGAGLVVAINISSPSVLELLHLVSSVLDAITLVTPRLIALLLTDFKGELDQEETKAEAKAEVDPSKATTRETRSSQSSEGASGWE